MAKPLVVESVLSQFQPDEALTINELANRVRQLEGSVSVTGNWIKYLSVLIARHPKYFKRTGTRKNRKYLRSEEGEAALSAKTVETAVLGAVTKDSFVSIRTVMRRSKLSRSIVKQELAELRSQGRVRYRWGEKTNESEWCLV